MNREPTTEEIITQEIVEAVYSPPPPIRNIADALEAAIWLNNYINGVTAMFGYWAFTGIVLQPPVGTGDPVVTLPAGVSYSEGPCLNWGDGQAGPFPFTSFGAFICGYQAQRTQRARATDAQVNADLAAGVTVSLQGELFRPDGYWWYQTYARIVADDPANFEPWDSARHGVGIETRRADWVQEAHRLYEDAFSHMQDKPQFNWDVLRDPIPGSTRLPAEWQNPATWPPGKWPIVISPDGDVSVPWPYPGGKVVDQPVPQWPTRPSRNPRKPERPGQRPDIDVDGPGVPDVPVNRPFAGRPGTSRRLGPQVRVNNGFRRSPGRGEKERKGLVARVIWVAMNTLGAVSEFEDAIKAIYKALPKKIRAEAFVKNGKHNLSPANKLIQLILHYDQIDMQRAVAFLILGQVDDLIASMQSAQYDRRMRAMQPDFEQRMATRAAVRWARKLAGEDSPNFEDGGLGQVSVEDQLRKLGYLDYVGHGDNW